MWIVIPVVLLALVLWIAFRIPKEVRISRSLLIPVAPAELFPYVNNTRLVAAWNPFVDGDPTAKIQHQGPEEGIGAVFAWEGKSGVGQSTITSSEPNKRVEVRLDFQKPFKVTNYGEYQLLQETNGTRLTWIVIETAFIPRAMSVLMNLEKMIGSHFERGLAKLSQLVTAGKDQPR